jgi:endonuclease/exonuclease/phosphatase family metal-dependent hydrolase
MKYKLLQLNIDMGNHIEELVPHLIKNNYDILHFQELGGKKRTTNGMDTFNYISEKLPDYKGYLVKLFKVINKSDNYMGSATFIKNNIQVKKFEEVWMTDFWEITADNDNPINRPYAVLSVEIGEANNPILLLNGHFTWGSKPVDTDITIQRAKKVYDYIKKSDKPFILSGDFNVGSQTTTVMQFEEFGSNLIKVNNITNTLNPRLHRAKHLFPTGVACDQMIISGSIETLDFSLIEEDISDHFGLKLEFNLE